MFKCPTHVSICNNCPQIKVVALCKRVGSGKDVDLALHIVVLVGSHLVGHTATAKIRVGVALTADLKYLRVLYAVP